MSKWSSAFRDSRWQQKRLEIMERDKWTCRSCGASGEGVTLNVHHAYYESGKAPWEYPSQSLITWCEFCHTKRHAMMKQMQEELITCTLTAAIGALQLTINYQEVFEAVEESAGNMPGEHVIAALIRAASEAHEDAYVDGHDAGKREAEESTKGGAA